MLTSIRVVTHPAQEPEDGLRLLQKPPKVKATAGQRGTVSATLHFFFLPPCNIRENGLKEWGKSPLEQVEVSQRELPENFLKTAPGLTRN